MSCVAVSVSALKSSKWSERRRNYAHHFGQLLCRATIARSAIVARYTNNVSFNGVFLQDVYIPSAIFPSYSWYWVDKKHARVSHCSINVNALHSRVWFLSRYFYKVSCWHKIKYFEDSFYSAKLELLRRVKTIFKILSLSCVNKILFKSILTRITRANATHSRW